MEIIVRGLTCEPFIMFLGGVIVMGHTFQEPLFNLRKLFQRFREASLKAQSREVPTAAEGTWVPHAYCDT
jgi:hypothetical protein